MSNHKVPYAICQAAQFEMGPAGTVLIFGKIKPIPDRPTTNVNGGNFCRRNDGEFNARRSGLKGDYATYPAAASDTFVRHNSLF
jgi:hypothetical protein